MKHSLLSLLLLLATTKVYPWGGIGHQTMGEIAERNLTTVAHQSVTDILGPEKLAVAAVWADDVRDDPDYASFAPYHFISLDDGPYGSSLPDQKDSFTILKKVPEILKDKNAPRSLKMVALRFLIHIVGDVHQPMHIGKKEDSGGNSCHVMWDKQKLSLHQVWDGKIIEYDISKLRTGRSPLKNYNFISYADDIIKLNPLPTTNGHNFLEWINESQELRKQAYPSNAPSLFCKRDSLEFPLIEEDYKKRGALITQERLYLAGLRLAHLLNDIFKDGTNPGTNVSLSKKQILELMNLNNEVEIK